MARSAQIYDFTLAANGSAVLLVEGGYYRLQTATGAVQVRRDGGSSISPLYPGQGERAEFTRLTITDKTGAANVGTIIIADDNFIDERITGEVSVIDGGLFRSINNKNFMCGVDCAALVGNLSHVQLWNPHASLFLAVDLLTFSAQTAGSILKLNVSSVACTTLQVIPQAKRMGGAASVAELRTQQNVTALGGATFMNSIYPPATFTQMTLKEPIVVPPANGLMVLNLFPNANVAAGFSFYEFTP